MQKRYQLVVHREDGTILFARPWGIVGEDEADFEAEVLDTFGSMLRREAHYMRQLRKRKDAA